MLEYAKNFEAFRPREVLLKICSEVKKVRISLVGRECGLIECGRRLSCAAQTFVASARPIYEKVLLLAKLSTGGLSEYSRSPN